MGQALRRRGARVVVRRLLDIPVMAKSRILVVDDHRDTTDILSKLLTFWGYGVQVEPDGPSALATAMTQRPEVILLDLGLPGMDGFEVAKRLRAQDALKQVFLVSITGYAVDEYRQRAEQAGFDDHLVKPLRPETLLQLLSKHTVPPNTGPARRN